MICLLSISHPIELVVSDCCTPTLKEIIFFLTCRNFYEVRVARSLTAADLWIKYGKHGW